jgi:Tfp pilus assembly protein PilX
MTTRNLVRDEQGIAFPMVMIVMAILTALMAAFAVLATSEPRIASNQMKSIQARALAESGVERALWALTQGEASTPPTGALVNSGPPNYTITMVAPYDGSQEVTQGVGSFKVTVANGAASNIKIVTAVGYVPNATNPVAIKKIVTQVTRLKWIDPLCGLCAGGEQPPGDSTTVKVGGTATVNASQSGQGKVPAGAYCSGVMPQAAVASTGTVVTNGTPNLYAPPGGYAQENNATYPSGMLLSNADTATLKAMAMAQGTYYKGNPPWNGGVPPKNGIIFVDTTDGSVLTNSTPTANIPTVTIHGNGTWSGWLVVAGSLDISGNIQMSGLIYAQNDATLHGIGTGQIQGAIITTNRIDTSSTNIDSTDTGQAPVVYNCPAVRNGGGVLSQNWFVMPGTYRDVSGS